MSVDTLKSSAKTSNWYKVDTIKVASKKQILGTWIEINKENLTVQIDEHFFNYIEHHEKLKYKFHKDTISIFHFNNKFGGKPYIITDTLFLLGDDNYCLKFIRKNHDN
ncbi:MAG: hypothetical protein NTZ59_05690 [Bacteroidetes bacterium]|nr:hypothetical protein [Bacteroidota bacterium]